MIPLSGRLIRRFLCVSFTILVLYETQFLWHPFISVEYATKFIATDSGKGPIFWAPYAAASWKNKLYVPLKKQTNGFYDIKNPARDTLVEMLLVDTSSEWMWVCDSLLSSQDVENRMSGFLVARLRNYPIPNDEVRVEEIRGWASNLSGDIEVDTRVADAIMVMGRTQLSGLIPIIQAQLTHDRSARIRWAACDVLARIPKEEQPLSLQKLVEGKHLCNR